MQIDYPTASHLPSVASCPPEEERVAAPDSRPASRVLGAQVRRWAGPVVIALIAFELLIRTLIYSPRPQVADPLLGLVPAPRSTWVNGREGYGRTHWSRQSIRGQDLPPDTANVRRVVVLGDSFCHAEAVSDRQTYCALLESELTRRLGQDVWLGNCGLGGRDAADYLYMLPAYEQKFRPDLVLITFTLSDFRLVAPGVLPGLTAQFDPAAPPSRALAARSVTLSKQNEMSQRLGPRLQSLARSVVDHSALAMYAAKRLYDAAAGPDPAVAGTNRDAIGREDQIATVEQMERYFAAVVARTNIPVACAYIGPWSPLGDPNNHFHAVVEQRLHAATARFGIPFVATGPALREHVQRTGQPAHGFANTHHGPGRGHLNPAGHAVVAQTLAPTVSRLLAKGSGSQLAWVARRQHQGANAEARSVTGR